MKEPRRPGAIRGGLRIGIGIAVAVVLLPLASKLGISLGALGDLFGSERHERADATVLTALADMEELHAARAELQVVVEIEDDVNYLPDFIAGETTTFLASGSVEAVIDLGKAKVTERPDGTVVVTLPEPTLDTPQIDSGRSRILDRDRGIFNRVGDVFTDNPDDDTDLYSLAESELSNAAGQTELRDRAKDNIRKTIENLAKDLGVDQVTVEFEVPPPTT